MLPNAGVNVTMSDLSGHWDNIFGNRKSTELGWFESDVNHTVEFLGKAIPSANRHVFIAGAGTSKLVEYLHERNLHLILNDISATALTLTRNRLGEHTRHFYFNTDLGQPFSSNNKTHEIPQSVDLWVDRATLHFLTEQNQIDQYFINLRQLLNVGGYVMLAQFVIGGATHCAGLPIKQWTIDEFQLNLGVEFRLQASQYFDFVAPSGDVKPYVYGLFKRTPI